MEQQKRYEVFDRIYTKSMQEKKDERDRCGRQGNDLGAMALAVASELFYGERFGDMDEK